MTNSNNDQINKSNSSPKEISKEYQNSIKESTNNSNDKKASEIIRSAATTTFRICNSIPRKKDIDNK